MKHRLLGAAAGLLLILVGAGPAAADDSAAEERSGPSWRSSYNPDSIEAYSLMLQLSALRVSTDAYELSTPLGVNDPAPLAGRKPSLVGEAWAYGAGLRGTLQGDSGFRGGLGLSIYKVDGLELQHEPLPEGVTASLGDVWLTNVEIFFGKAFDAVYLYPYVDARLAIDFLSTSIELEVAEYGYLGATEHMVPSVTFAPRVGAFIPVDEDCFFDLSGQYGLFGAERAGVFLGFGIWED